MSSKISLLTAASALAGTELLPGVQGGGNVAITAAQLAAYVMGLGEYPEVLDFASLPSAAANAGKDYLVQTTTGSWLTLTRKPAGLYRSNGSTWSWLGDAPTTASLITFTPTGNIVATDVQSALAELDTEKLTSASNLSDLGSAATARTNLGLKTGALVNISVGTVAPSSPAVGDLWVDMN